MKTNKFKFAGCSVIVLFCLLFGFLAMRGTASSSRVLPLAEQILVDAGVPEFSDVAICQPAIASTGDEISKSLTTHHSVSETRAFYEQTMGEQGWHYQASDMGRANSYSNEFHKGNQVFMLSATPAQQNHQHTFIRISYRKLSNAEQQSRGRNGSGVHLRRQTREIGFQ